MSAEFDPFSHVIHEDPYAVYQALRDEEPAYYNERHDYLVLSRFEDVQAAARDWRTWSKAAGVDTSTAPAGSTPPATFLDMDPPRRDLFVAYRRELVRRGVLEMPETSGATT